MSKKEHDFPTTKVETAEKRLEELISHDSIEAINQSPQNYYHSVKGGKMKLYPDGYEVASKSSGRLYLKNIDILVWYDIKKEREQQTLLVKGEK